MESRQHLFSVVEMTKKSVEKYALKMTDKEMSKYLKGKREVNGFIEGVGGDRSYSIIAWYMDY